VQIVIGFIFFSMSALSVGALPAAALSQWAHTQLQQLPDTPVVSQLCTVARVMILYVDTLKAYITAAVANA
jgi:hypothetical protein